MLSLLVWAFMLLLLDWSAWVSDTLRKLTLDDFARLQGNATNCREKLLIEFFVWKFTLHVVYFPACKHAGCAEEKMDRKSHKLVAPTTIIFAIRHIVLPTYEILYQLQRPDSLERLLRILHSLQVRWIIVTWLRSSSEHRANYALTWSSTRSQ